MWFLYLGVQIVCDGGLIVVVARRTLVCRVLVKDSLRPMRDIVDWSDRFRLGHIYVAFVLNRVNGLGTHRIVLLLLRQYVLLVTDVEGHFGLLVDLLEGHGEAVPAIVVLEQVAHAPSRVVVIISGAWDRASASVRLYVHADVEHVLLPE